MFINREMQHHVDNTIAITQLRDEGRDGQSASEPRHEMRYSIFSNAFDVAPETFESTFDELEEACSNPAIREVKDGLAFCPGTFWPEHRKVENAKSCAFLAFDLDSLPELVSAGDVLNCIPNHRAFCYSTYCHREPGKGSRFRVVVEVIEPIPAHLYKSVAISFGMHFQRLTGKVDHSCASPAQMLYYPACPKDRADKFEFQSQQGEPVDWTKTVEKTSAESAPSVSQATNYGLGYSVSSLIPQGERNNTLFKIAAALRRDGADLDEIKSELQRSNIEQCVPPLPDDEVSAIAHSAAKYAPEQIFVGDETLTQLALAQSVAATHRGTIQWVSEWGTWMRLDPNTKLWKRENRQGIERLLIDDLRQRRVREADLVKRGAKRHHAIKGIENAEKASFLRGAEELLRTVTDNDLSPSDFDADNYLVGLPDGLCIDLKTVTVRAIEPTDYLTKRLSASYDPDADCPVWKKSIKEWCCGDKELERFLQVWCGYSLSGLTEFQGFLFLYGSGCNGKSVFINVISKLMNNYSKSIAPTTLMAKSNVGGATPDIALLHGARLVTSVELPEGKQFDEVLLKQLTGGDIVTARDLYQSFFSFNSTLKLMIAGNHEPVIKGTDEGIWRRVFQIPFVAKIEERNPHLFEILASEQSGIINWCIEGWESYQQEGLVIPEVVKACSAKYRDSMDLMKQWREECLVHVLDSETSAKDLYKSYQQWSIENGFTSPITSNSFNRKLKPLLGEPTRKSSGKFYQNCRLKRRC